MIPKVIHYCWFGRGEKSRLIKKCIKSWKKHCPDYEIIEWNEDNFDVNSTPWTKQAYEAKKWAFVSDYVRLWVLKNHGGIYLDTDVEVIKSFDDLLFNTAFTGFDCPDTIGTCVIAAEKGSTFVEKLFSYYDYKDFGSDGKLDLVPNGTIVGNILKEYGLKHEDKNQFVLKCQIYPRTYFAPTNYDDFKTFFTENTYSIHYFDSSWRSKKSQKDRKRLLRHQTKWYKAYEQIAAYPIALYNKIFKRNK